MRSPLLLLPLLQLLLVSGSHARPAPSRAHAHRRSLVARAIVEAGEQEVVRRETPPLLRMHACDTGVDEWADAEVRLGKRADQLAPRRSSDDEEPEDEESDDEDEEERSSSSKKGSSRTKSSSDDDESSTRSNSKSSPKKSSSTKSSSNTKSASTSSASSGSDVRALPTVTPVAGAPQVLAAPTPAPAAAGAVAPSAGMQADMGTPQSSKKAAQLAAQLAAARQRAIDGSRLAATAAVGPAGASYAAISDPNMMTGATSSAWLSPAPGAAYLSGQDVVLSWHQATQDTPSVQLALCLLANSNDLRAAQAGVVVAGSCGAPMSAEVTPSVSGQAGVWEIRFPAPNVPSADSFYVQLTPSTGEAVAPASQSQSATDVESESTSTSGWKRQSRSASSTKTSSAEDAEPTSSWKSKQREDKKSSADDEEDEGDEEDWRRRDAGDMPSSALISPAFVLAPLGTDLTAPAAPPAQNTNDEVGTTDKQRPVPLVGIIVPLVVIAVALLGALALCLFRRGRQSAQARRTAELVAETQSRAEARREMAQLRQAASSSALSLSRSHSSSIRSGSSRSVGGSYAPRRQLEEIAPPSDAYTPISAQRRFTADRFGSSLAPPVEYRTLASEVGTAAPPRRRDTTTSCGSSAAAHDYRAARGCQHDCGSDAGSESYEALLSRRPTTLSTRHSDVEIHPTHLHMRLASPQPAHLAAAPASPMPPALPEKPRVPAALQPAVLGVPTGASTGTHWTALSPISSEATPRTEQRSPLANPFRNPSPSIAAPSPSVTSMRAASYGAAEKAPSGRRGGPAGTVSEESVQRAGAAADLYEQLRRALSGGA